MSLQRSHGKSYPLVSPPDELHAGRAAPSAEPCVPVPRDASGRFHGTEAAKEMGRRGGRAHAARAAALAAYAGRLSLTRHLDQLQGSEHLAPYLNDAEQWLTATATELASTTGGGRLSPMVTSILQSAAWSRCFSSFFYDCASRQKWLWVRSADKPNVAERPSAEYALVGARLATESRQHLIAAFEIAAKECQAREQSGGGLAHLCSSESTACASSARSDDEPQTASASASRSAPEPALAVPSV